MTERAQSEILGFPLVFGLVLATMSAITVVGLSGLQDVRDAERAANADRAFDILADNIDDIVHGGATSQKTEISLSDSRLYFEDPVEVTVSGQSVADPTRNFTFSYATRPIVLEPTADRRIVYTAGVTFREDRSGAVMQGSPPFVLTPEQSVVQIVQTRSVGRPSAVAGSSTVRVRTQRARTDPLRVEDTTYNLTIDVDSPRATAWARHLDDISGMDCTTPAGGSVSCSITTDHVSVSVVRVDVLLE